MFDELAYRYKKAVVRERERSAQAIAEAREKAEQSEQQAAQATQQAAQATQQAAQAKQESQNMVYRMFAYGYKDKAISAVTGMSVDEVVLLKKYYKSHRFDIDKQIGIVRGKAATH